MITRRGFLSMLSVVPVVGPHMLLCERPTWIGWSANAALPWWTHFHFSVPGEPWYHMGGTTEERARKHLRIFAEHHPNYKIERMERCLL